MSKTSAEWWEETVRDQAKLTEWLKKQHRGEATAADRILAFAEKYATAEHQMVLGVIATQERRHAEWVLGLLSVRGIEPDTSNAEERYWKETLPGIEDFETGAGVAAHAERMRLERIRAIVASPETPADVREVFARILPEEEFHARAFRGMADWKGLVRTEEFHERGAEALGLVL